MRKSVAIKTLFVLLALAAVATGAFAIPDLPPAPYPGACGYMPYVASPPYYWVGEAVSYSQCVNVALPALITQAHKSCPWCILTETTCRPAQWCA